MKAPLSTFWMTVQTSAPLCMLLIFLSVGCPQAFAQHMNLPGLPCNRPSTTAAEYGCFAKASAAADKDLNMLYTRVQAVLAPEERRDLMEAQRAWLRYRDLTCTAEYKLYGNGTGGPVTQQACLAVITQERLVALKATCGWRLEK